MARADTQRLSWRDAGVAVGLWLVVGTLASLMFRRGPMVGVNMIFGPFAGTVMRGRNNTCCLDWAWTLVPYVVPVLLAGVCIQWLVAPTTVGRRRLRLVSWSLTCAWWILSAFVSYLHALE